MTLLPAKPLLLAMTKSTQMGGDEMQKTTRVVMLILFSSPLVAQVAAQEERSPTTEKERSAIERAIQSYVAAFNAQDARAMAQ